MFASAIAIFLAQAVPAAVSATPASRLGTQYRSETKANGDPNREDSAEAPK